ncbi:tRNA (adenosine(37)-N6)-threonylcarbamoyltransferase complex dimerization subunit type 1 TsaB [Neobacillus sp. PS3-34]|uniref:tRNA (adenosine(37)-N6)-threonylcarbamoyltransferase complex dimerization subunit type 1 TsaB n=1 Tax=Neobacillus sp. PS3-34 TaxID=3070678 RepID=UPI0027E0ED42|nr:tRNA (adenosine(37)-N6)-threonylcarbamoyltransferase complex dimerization subunit type 1 TsaB [Neobacillus sp. PS3-34]WML50179.1 tRNA (adenosine(37)-N6)-threonylcarbamoyltransferase complex dimerization subunit type 1 TsaB [Neobacillus sp. PS3-34]
MKILALDTSNYTLGVALVDDEKVLGEYITYSKKNHSVRIMPAIQTLMKDCDWNPGELDRIVVAKGPGSYTGVRIGVTIAKTLAWSLKIPLVGVSSLEILAAGAGRYFNGSVAPLFDARRGQIYTGLYQSTNGKMDQLEKDQLIMISDWTEKLKNRKEKILFIGNDVSIHRSFIEEKLGEQAVFAEMAENNPRPSELALLGKNRPSEDVHSFVPNYIRLAEAEAKWLEANGQSKQG